MDKLLATGVRAVNASTQLDDASPSLVLLNLLINLQWNTVNFLHDNSTSGDVSMLLTTAAFDDNHMMKYGTFNIDHIQSAGEMLNVFSMTYKLSTELSPHYLLYCSDDCVNRVLNVANDFDLQNRKISYDTALRHYSKWIIVVPEYLHSDVELWASKLDNVLTIPVVNSCLKIRKGDCSSYSVKTLFWREYGREFNRVGYLTSSYNWIFVHDPYPNLRFGFNGENFKIGILQIKPWLYKAVNNGTVVYTGFCIDMIYELARLMNFTCTFIEPEDGEWGRILNGRWTGLIGQLARMEVDIVSADISIQAVREEVVDFVHPYLFEVNAVMIRRPDPTAQKQKTYMRPFSLYSWITLGAVLVFVILVFYFAESKAASYIYPEKKRTEESSFTELAFFILGALVQHGAKYTPSTSASKVILSVWWIMAMVMVTAYISNLVALLTVTLNNMPFRTLEGMINQDVYTWGTLPGSHMFMTFEKSARLEYRQLWEGMLRFSKSDPDVYSSNHSLHVEKMKKGNYAYITDLINLELLKADSCDLVVVQETFLPMMYSIGLTNNSPYRTKYNQLMERLDQYGYFKMLVRHWLPPLRCSNLAVSSQAKPLTLADVQSASYIAIFGISLTIITAVLEKIWVKCSKNVKDKSDQSILNNKTDAK